jgi:hypothetical protein
MSASVESNVQGCKVNRNLGLLELELAERLDDPFVLFNLGAIRLTQGNTMSALEVLQCCLERMQPGESLERKVRAQARF